MIGLLRLANRDQGLGRPRDELGRFSAHHVASSKGRGCERKYWRDSRKSQENHSEQLEEGRGEGKGFWFLEFWVWSLLAVKAQRQPFGVVLNFSPVLRSSCSPGTPDG